jgi:serine/threonine protein kinase/cytochrome c-type biogenesis protein CcmH/NrfG
LEDKVIGQTVANYKILEKLGEGGMGVVYKAEDIRLRREVAIKFLPPSIAQQEIERERFKIEARAAAALNHPNIATVHAIEETKDKIFFVMEYIDGEALKKRIEAVPLKIEEIMDIAVQVTAGLQAAHDKNIVHRDIKSSNILLTKEKQVKITDFGLAKLGGGAQITKTGTTVGTIAYMSPEQVQAHDVDHRSDLWSFGVLLYEMLTRQLPFQGDYEAAIIYEILNSDPLPIQKLRPDVPEHLIPLISRLLQKDPFKRVSSAREVTGILKNRPAAKALKEAKTSIAVLYFENMSSDKENEYFCAGMTEDLIIDLSKIRQIRVIPRSDVLPLRDKEISSHQIGKTLGTDYILEGSVRKSGNRIRITARLIDVKSGYQVWGERYDRLVEDIFDVQIEVSKNIAESLKISLTESEKQSLAKKPTDDLRAYDFYMRGSELLSRRGRKERDTAVQMFEHALSIDPNFTLPYLGLAEAYFFNHCWYGSEVSDDRSWLEKMMEMNESALKIDPNLIEAQFSIGLVYFAQKRFNEAFQCFEKVAQRKTDFYPAYYWLGLTSDVLKEYGGAQKYYKKATALKPYSEEPWHFLDQSYRRSGDIKKALAASDKVIELGMRKLELNPNDIWVLGRVAITRASRGDREKALAAVKKAVKVDPNDAAALYNCAGAYVCLGMKEEAIAHLRMALEKGIMIFSEWMEWDPFFESIRDDPRFREIIFSHDV